MAPTGVPLMSPTALLKACPTVGCPNLSEHGKCPTCRTRREQVRGSAASRGYDRKWNALRARFRRELIAAGIPPVCGARLPGAKPAPQSKCLAANQLLDDTLHRLRYGKGLHTDHIVPHKGHPALLYDILDLQLLCEEEHSSKTATEDGGFGR